MKALIDIKDLGQKYPIACSPEVCGAARERIAEYSEKAEITLQSRNPFREEEGLLTQCRYALRGGDVSPEHLKTCWEGYNRLSQYDISPKTEKSYWQKAISKYSAAETAKKRTKQWSQNLASEIELLLSSWEIVLYKCQAKWELEERTKFQKKLLDELEKWLQKLQELAELLKGFEGALGYFIDFSKGNLSPQDTSQLQKVVDYLKNNKSVKDLCDLLGRIRRAEKTAEMEKIQSIETILVDAPTDTMREEISGITIGDNINDALTQELALLCDESTEMLFYKKYAEEELLCFDMMGYAHSEMQVETEEEVSVEKQRELGPIILCIDTSGSMHGTPESIAKAVAFTMALRAKSQKRKCLLLSFSTRITVTDLSESISAEGLMDFLSLSFHGGTDATPAFKYALKQMKKEEYALADVLVVSDFVMAGLPASLHEAIAEQKKKGNKFHALSIGNLFMPGSNRVFDNQWVYNPDTMSVRQLAEQITGF